VNSKGGRMFWDSANISVQSGISAQTAGFVSSAKVTNVQWPRVRHRPSTGTDHGFAAGNHSDGLKR